MCKTIFLYLVLFFLTCCQTNSNSIRLSVLNKDNNLVQITGIVDSLAIDELLNSSTFSDFSKILLNLANEDHLVVEQKNEEGYLVIVKMDYEQFLIKNQPKSKEELKKIMLLYIRYTDEILNKIEFY